MSEMELLDLASGDPVSQDGSLQGFRYSQFSACPSAPFNTAVPECLPSPFHLSTSLATSPLLELEDPNSGPLEEPSSGLLISSTKSDVLVEGANCNSQCAEILQPDESFSDSLGLSQFDAYSWSKKCGSSPRRTRDLGMLEERAQVSEVGVSKKQSSPVHSPIQDSPRRIYCDSRFLDEETQVLDAGFLSSNQQALYLLSPKQHLQSAHQKTAAEPKNSLPLLAVNQGCREVKDFDDICQRWHSRRTATPIPSSSAAMGLSAETHLDMVRPSTSRALDSDQFRVHPTGVDPGNAGPWAATQVTSTTVVDGTDILPKYRDRRRVTLSAITKINSLANIGLPLEAKQEIMTPSTSGADYFRGQPTVLGSGIVSSSTATNQDIIAAVADDDDADIVRRWYNRKRIALSAITNLSSTSDSDPCKKLKQTPETVIESGAVHSGPPQPLLVDYNSVSRYGHDRPCEDTISSRGGSETTEEAVNFNDVTDDCCDSKLHRKLSYSRARGIKSFLQVNARIEASVAISSTDELGVSKSQKSWTYPRKSRPRVRQRTMDAWIR